MKCLYLLVVGRRSLEESSIFCVSGRERSWFGLMYYSLERIRFRRRAYMFALWDEHQHFPSFLYVCYLRVFYFYPRFSFFGPKLWDCWNVPKNYLKFEPSHASHSNSIHQTKNTPWLMNSFFTCFKSPDFATLIILSQFTFFLLRILQICIKEPSF